MQIPANLECVPPLHGLLTLPDETAQKERGVVICAPLGHQNTCAYRPLRSLAERLAETGYPVLRFDWPGCGDSGNPAPGVATDWVGVVDQAIQTLTSMAGVSDVTLIGIGAGATFAAAASGNPGVSALILLSPFATGKSVLHELRAFDRLAGRHSAEAHGADIGLRPGDLEASGFVLRAEDVAGVGAIDIPANLASITVAARRVLILSAQPDRGATQLFAFFSDSVPDVDTRLVPEVASICDAPDVSVFPRSCSDLVLSWLADDGAGFMPSARPPSSRRLLCPRSDVREETVILDGPNGHLVGVVCESVIPGRSATNDWLLFLNAGAVRRSGPHRLWTEFARIWAARGLNSLRIDVSGVGDSDDPRALDETHGADVGRFYTGDILGDIRSALSWLDDRGAARVGTLGLCSGAYWSFHAALAGEGLATIVMANPATLFWDEHVHPANTLSHAGGILRSPRSWHRIVRRGAREQVGTVMRGMRTKLNVTAQHKHYRDDITEAVALLAERKLPAQIVFSEGDLGLLYLKRHLGAEYRTLLESHGMTLDIIQGPDHTFTPVWSHAVLRETVERHLERVGLLARGPGAG
ncbi:MAG: alpha/beta fold hydrolase [Thermoleophilia bacterium]